MIQTHTKRISVDHKWTSYLIFMYNVTSNKYDAIPFLLYSGETPIVDMSEQNDNQPQAYILRIGNKYMGNTSVFFSSL
jgi:hypothetical protein